MNKPHAFFRHLIFSRHSYAFFVMFGSDHYLFGMQSHVTIALRYRTMIVVAPLKYTVLMQNPLV